MSEISKVITPAECYWLPVGWLTGRPRPRSQVELDVGVVSLRNLRAWGELTKTLVTDDEVSLRQLSNTIRNGSGFTGRPALSDQVRHGRAPVQVVQPQTDDLNHKAKNASADLWLAFLDESFQRRRALPMARFMGVVINTDVEQLGPRFQPVVQTVSGEPALVPNTYEQGWLHFEA